MNEHNRDQSKSVKIIITLFYDLAYEFPTTIVVKLYVSKFCRSEMNSAKSILPNFPVERFFCLHK